MFKTVRFSFSRHLKNKTNNRKYIYSCFFLISILNRALFLTAG